ncbi:aldehyde dehydrogenase [Flavobacterium sp. IMCC34852]|uniref:Aldehyde dehydrogenase n=1 Tax=Flavobacterium rivulicola TaxID=2732161 RepID=A0A7Y3VZ74_9FLAO|nr:aldehyde dehydrogenase [Flavobacterium sp. IMCC34852]NNT72181.1 aldehyde dehydrogenase [Flavobacterium sp. IMCC34852]
MIFKTDLNYRKQSLLKLLLTVENKEAEIIQALHDDFKKPAFEAVATETSFIVSELKYTIKNLNLWAKPQRVLPSFLNFPSADYLYPEPYGKILIIAPWNYPYQLVFAPLIAAVAAGNQVVVKPSELTPNTSKVIAEIIQATFEENHVQCVLGGIDVSQNLLSQRWDYIFFTGSVTVGKIVAKAAAVHLTPVTLELGGKNPCIVEATANLKLAAKRIVWGKFLNAGQTCIAPDYLLVDQNIKPKLIEYLKEEITLAYGENPQKSPDYPRIINEKNWRRQISLLENQVVLLGGKTSADDFYVSPTLLDEPSLDSLVMQEEIFGPILPILGYKTEADLERIITRYEKPLSLYLFSQNKKFVEKILAQYSFGGGCVNDTLIHFANKRLPFGGVGHSGIGAYHGKRSFELFSHQKAIVKKANWLDITIRYAPYKGKLGTLKKLLKWFS